ncbi:MAG: NAD(P)H-hydrate dehydratase [Flavobacteriaceae bacterium]|jgi:NAD(P)H-hydrate epimerase|nr:NAD(P)H-hydrate dehydratase [Flavobacteriaceae bacterium]
MKIFKKVQIRKCDECTIQHEQISSIDLMERAASVCFEWIQNKYSDEYTFYIVCGKGNNGGDGLALARMLLNKNYKVEVFIIQSSSDFVEDTQINFERFPESVYFLEGDDFEIPEGKTVIIDALFGTGLNKPLQGAAEKIVSKLNSIQAIKVAIDIPSGLLADELPKEDQTIFYADETLSFGFYKRSFLHKEGAKYVGNVHIMDIGLNEEFIQEEETDNYIIVNKDFIKEVKVRDPFSNKGDFGKAVLIGGSYGKIGAITLSTRAALKSGAGLTYALAPECGYGILQNSVPEAMFISGGEKYIEKADLPSKDCKIGIGTGLGTEDQTKKVLKDLLKQASEPLVIDADALNILAETPEMLSLLPENTIITPHPKEFERLFGETSSTMEQCELARKKAKENKIIIVLKGHYTTVLLPNGDCYYNINGNAGMAKGGSGDVLTGVITGLLAQGYEPDLAAMLGVFIQGKAGDYAAEKYSQEAMTAQDIIECLSDVFLELRKGEGKFCKCGVI